MAPQGGDGPVHLHRRPSPSATLDDGGDLHGQVRQIAELERGDVAAHAQRGRPHDGSTRRHVAPDDECHAGEQEFPAKSDRSRGRTPSSHMGRGDFKIRAIQGRVRIAPTPDCDGHLRPGSAAAGSGNPRADPGARCRAGPSRGPGARLAAGGRKLRFPRRRPLLPGGGRPGSGPPQRLADLEGPRSRRSPPDRGGPVVRIRRCRIARCHHQIDHHADRCTERSDDQQEQTPLRHARSIRPPVAAPQADDARDLRQDLRRRPLTKGASRGRCRAGSRSPRGSPILRRTRATRRPRAPCA